MTICHLPFFKPNVTFKIIHLPSSQVTKNAIQSINPNNDRPLHVSFDIDALDPTEAPATGTRGN